MTRHVTYNPNALATFAAACLERQQANEAGGLVWDPHLDQPVWCVGSPVHLYALRTSEEMGMTGEAEPRWYVAACHRDLYERAVVHRVAFGTVRPAAVTCGRCKRTRAFRSRTRPLAAGEAVRVVAASPSSMRGRVGEYVGPSDGGGCDVRFLPRADTDPTLPVWVMRRTEIARVSL